MSSQYQ